MKKKKLALNLSKTSIQLLLGHENGKWKMIGCADPGSENINKEISTLKNQASAIYGKKPVVDIFLPKELILSQTIIVEENISVDDCKKIIADRCGLNTHELYVAIGKPSTRRTLPVAAITVKSIGETRNFVRNKGFLPHRFIAAEKISGFKDPPVFIKDKTNWQAVDFDSNATLKVISAFSLLLFFGFLFSLGSTILEYREKSKPHSFLSMTDGLAKIKSETVLSNYQVIENIRKSVKAYQNPKNFTNFTPTITKPEISVRKMAYEVSSNKYLFSEKQKISGKMIRDFSSKQFNLTEVKISTEYLTFPKLGEGKKFLIDQAERSIKTTSFFNSVKRSKHPFVEKEVVIAALAIDIPKNDLQSQSEDQVVGLKKIKNILKNLKISPFKEFKHEDYQKVVIEEVFTDISLSKISIKSDLSRASVLPAIFSFSPKPLVFITDIKTNNYKESLSSIMPKASLNKPAYEKLKKLETIALLDSQVKISKTLQKKLTRKDEIASELSTDFFLRPPLPLIQVPTKNFITLYKWTKNLPYSKPNIIDSIKIIDDPTKSSGAVTYVELPPKMPSSVMEMAKVSPSSIKNLSIRSKPPSIPRRSSIVGNSTLKNIIELNRTNLIGVFGKRSGRIALIRLASGSMVRVAVGQRFGEGWRVLSIDLDKIHISNGKRQETLRIPG